MDEPWHPNVFVKVLTCEEVAFAGGVSRSWPGVDEVLRAGLQDEVDALVRGDA